MNDRRRRLALILLTTVMIAIPVILVIVGAIPAIWGSIVKLWTAVVPSWKSLLAIVWALVVGVALGALIAPVVNGDNA